MCGVGFDKLYEEIETKEEKKNFCSFSNEKKKAFIYFSVFKMDFLEPWEVFYFFSFDCFQPIV